MAACRALLVEDGPQRVGGGAFSCGELAVVMEQDAVLYSRRLRT
jgi:hypothetical protein